MLYFERFWPCLPDGRLRPTRETQGEVLLMPLRRNRWVAIGITATVTACGLAVVVARSAPGNALAAPHIASSSLEPQSCKVAPDVVVRLESMGGSSWRVHLDALAPVSEVVVRVGTNDAAAAARIVWHGA